jgi:hypothetical protein
MWSMRALWLRSKIVISPFVTAAISPVPRHRRGGARVIDAAKVAVGCCEVTTDRALVEAESLLDDTRRSDLLPLRALSTVSARATVAMGRCTPLFYRSTISGERRKG